MVWAVEPQANFVEALERVISGYDGISSLGDGRTKTALVTNQGNGKKCLHRQGTAETSSCGCENGNKKAEANHQRSNLLGMFYLFWYISSPSTKGLSCSTKSASGSQFGSYPQLSRSLRWQTGFQCRRHDQIQLSITGSPLGISPSSLDHIQHSTVPFLSIKVSQGRALYNYPNHQIHPAEPWLISSKCICSEKIIYRLTMH